MTAIKAIADKYFADYRGFRSPAISTGFGEIDKALNLQRGDSILITTEHRPYTYGIRLCIPILFDLARHGKKVLIHSLFTDPSEILEYFLMCASPEIGKVSLRRGTIPELALRDAIGSLSELEINIEYRTKLNVAETIQSFKPDVVFVEGAHVHKDRSLIETMRKMSHNMSFLLLYSTAGHIFEDLADAVLVPDIEVNGDIARGKISISHNILGPDADIYVGYDLRRCIFLPTQTAGEVKL